MLNGLFEVLTQQKLRQLASSRIYARGRQYFLANRVYLSEVSPSYVSAQVLGTSFYNVEIHIDNGKPHFACDCPYEYFCKHLVAVGLQVEAYVNAQINRRATIKRAQVRRLSEWESYLQSIEQNGEPQKPKWTLAFYLGIKPAYWKLIAEKVYLRKNGDLGRHARMTFSALENSEVQMNEKEKFALSYAFANFDRMSSGGYSAHYYDYYETNIISQKMGADCGYLFSLLHDSNLFLKKDFSAGTPIRFSSETGRIQFRAKLDNRKVIYQPYLIWGQRDEPLSRTQHTILTSNPIWVLRNDTLIEIQGMKNASPLLPFMRGPFKLKIPVQEFITFLQKIDKQKDISQNLELSPELSIQEAHKTVVPRLYLEERQGQLFVELKFAYGSQEIDAANKSSHIFATSENGQTVLRIPRNPEAESGFHQALLATGIKQISETAYQPKFEGALDWLLLELPKLAEKGFEIYGEENLNSLKVRRSSPHIQVSVSSGIDWFDLKLIVDFDGILVSLAELQKSLRDKSRYIKLSDGSLVHLPQAWIKRFEHLLHFGEAREETIRLSHIHATLIDTLVEEIDEMHTDAAYEAFITRLRQFSGICKTAPPQNFKGKLRKYQQSGLDWLLFLQEFNFGGCLADDMGLGKTIQTLALLLHEKEKTVRHASLIVAPTSVVFNWERETQRFAPDLRFMVQTGTDRPRDIEAFDNYDIVLTTYGTLRRDITFLKEYPFHYVILDESQNIKNPVSQTAKTARLLTASHRLALTGTPIENNTLELWSQMAFLNPGMLGGQKYFRNTFANPIERKGDEQAAKFLHKLIYPFILRRTKEQVEKDLPPKTESVLYTTMIPSQEKFYHQWRDYYRAAILKEIDHKGLNKSRMVVLQGLMKLRQIACHPMLVEPNGGRSSGKYEALLEQLQEILSEGHKVLVFSQFVKMLKIIQRYLDSARIRYEYLDGHTRDREARVQNFQENEDIRIFLISLRAGGTGLNLTAADYVIHYDPWWNPAVEVQASDRTHRIGQEKHVFIYKLITRGTVEEKVLALQEKKRQLVDQLITTDRTFFKQLTAKDIEALFS